ncbi:hypothetical protein ZIOFF_010771 [Zingiber officinale]|uniref:Uncharacterized protein n=1 Tax=Zingiber officinale TaxID=94328 RepID=A0A8J5I1S5_ZINOF|nr:hypothetical protein ZIOFF_010771 [Zingiber officinale]
MGGRNYRVWWPQQLLTSTSSSGLFLFGWFMDSVDSIDIVIAAAISSAKILTHPFQTNLEEILVSANQKMPLRLESFTFSLLGYCLTDGGKLRPVCSQNGGLPFRKQFNDECYKELKACQNNGKWHCDCMNFIEPYFLSSLGCNNWIFMLLCKPQRILYKRNQQIPYLHHVHHNGDIVTPVDFHIIVYEVPTFGVSHVSMSSWHAPENIDLLSKKPKWVKEIYKKPVVDNFNAESGIHHMAHVTLQAPGTSISHSSVEYSHKAALRKHFIWSNVLMDVTLGIVLGILLLANSETICSWISVIVHQITNDLLRSGSVWLMGVPAGFKLNNEQAEFIGIISLNTIQIFSTLWSFIDVFLRYYILVLALLGIVFGLTIPVALCIDILKLATFHICILHHMISFLYSQQIQALASLWRLFR